MRLPCAAFEAVKIGRRAVAFDLNPLSAFFIEVVASAPNFDKKAFREAALAIKNRVEATQLYVDHFRRRRKGETATVLNYRWTDGALSGVALQADDGSRRLIRPDPHDLELADQMTHLEIAEWHPSAKFPSHPSVNLNFLTFAGGNTIDRLWTRRNLSLLADIFSDIRNVSDRNLRLQLLSAFVQSIHLCTKMVIPRHSAANRDYSGSWGRPDFLIRRRQMEQNAVDVFWRSCIGRQGVTPMMLDAARTFPDGIDIHDARATGKIRESADINYGAIDVADLLEYMNDGDADFIITDPPYAGLVRYLPLSVVWLCWLEKIDIKYRPNLKSEIKVEKNSVPSRNDYRRRLRNGFENLHRILRDDGKMAVTFHHQEVSEFNDFILAVKAAGFIPDKVTHQYNRRSGESNVANPYGVSGSDFYVRCTKRRDINFTDQAHKLEPFIIAKATEIIARRNEPTPYNFLFEALWPELLQAGFTQPQQSGDEIRRVLSAHEGLGKTFHRETNPDTRVGDLWWFNNPAEHISHPDRPLQGRIAESVLAILRRRVSVKLDDVIAELFREYPNGLTPDPRTIQSFLGQFAYREAGKWKLSPEAIASETRHSGVIASILKIGKKMGVRRFVGRREQPERTTGGEQLREFADIFSLAELIRTKGVTEEERIARLEMVDVVFLAAGPEILCLWEVENSTTFTSAIQRGSNADRTIPKFMVIPDERENELQQIHDPMFLEQFAVNNWRYLTYSDAGHLAGARTIKLPAIQRLSKSL